MKTIAFIRIDSFQKGQEPALLSTLIPEMMESWKDGDQNHSIYRQRKFVIAEKRDEKAEGAELVMIVGPVFSGDNNYVVRHLWNYATQFMPYDIGGVKIAKCVSYDRMGGGYLTIRRVRGDWTASIGGSSKDYGAFTPKLLQFQEEIARDQIGIETEFEYRNTWMPPKFLGVKINPADKRLQTS